MPTEASDDLLNERAQHLLRILIESYIRDGQPVGSRTLSRESGLNLSSATIRNVMADLEGLGFVTSPHTSAGRIPTDKGYRLFVDSLSSSSRSMGSKSQTCSVVWKSMAMSRRRWWPLLRSCFRRSRAWQES